MTHPGRANTAGDAVVYIPDARVLVTGGLVVWPTPYATSAYLVDWIAALRQLNAMDVAVVTQVDAAVRKGLSLEETQKTVDLEAFRKQFAGDYRRRNRAFSGYFVASAIKTAWQQARGEKTIESPF